MQNYFHQKLIVVEKQYFVVHIRDGTDLCIDFSTEFPLCYHLALSNCYHGIKSYS